MSSFTRTYVMQLDLSGNQIGVAQANALGAPGCWLRDLSLANNDLSEFPAMFSCPNLLRLDLSDNEFGSLDAFPAAAFPVLRELDISGCSIGSLLDEREACPLAGLSCL